MRSTGSYSRYFIVLTVMISGLLVAQDLSSVQVIKTYSPNKKYCLEIIPKGCDNNDSACLGNYYTVDSLENCHLKWSWILLNPIAPTAVLLTDDGNYMVTIDDWAMDGHGDHVIVIYSSEGNLIRNFSLDDFVPNDEIQKMQISDKKLLWRGMCRIDNNQGSLVVNAVANGEDPTSEKAVFRYVVVLLNNGGIVFNDITNWNNDYIPDIISFVPVEIPAKPVKQVYPSYPEMARKKGHQGTVYVKMLVDLNGTIMRVIVFKSSGYPELDSEAVKAAYKILFEPAQMLGKSVRVWVAMPIIFKLN